MSAKDLNSMKKAELIELVKGLMNGNLDVPTNSVDIADQLQELRKRNEELEQQLVQAKESEKYVGIENLSLGRVWLPSPEVKSGRIEDSNKGILLKKPGELVLIKAHWMLQYIADRATSFVFGEVRVNNERARELNPQANIVDIDLPPEFIRNSVTEKEIIRTALDGFDKFKILVDKYSDTKPVLSRISGVVTKYAESKKNDTSLNGLFEGYIDYIDNILNPVQPPIKEEE